MKKSKLCLALLIFILTPLLGCKRRYEDVNWVEEFRRMGDVGMYYDLSGRSSCIGRCQWKRISTDTLAFEGVIAKATLVEFLEKTDDNVKIIQVNSGGGDVLTGVKIARQIQRRNLQVHVKGFCTSSCANYLFLAGTEKKIDGVVGFHGSSNAYHKKYGDCDNSELKTKCDTNNEERKFFEDIKIDQFLFDMTHTRDKGLGKGVYSYYAPSAKTLKALGVENIIGDQSEEYLAQMKRLFDELGEVEFAVARDPNPAMQQHLLALKK